MRLPRLCLILGVVLGALLHSEAKSQTQPADLTKPFEGCYELTPGCPILPDFALWEGWGFSAQPLTLSCVYTIEYPQGSPTSVASQNPVAQTACRRF